MVKGIDHIVPGEKSLSKEELALAKGKIPGVFAKYAVPGVVGLLFIGLQAVIDGLIVGNFIGSNALASVSLVMPCFSFMTAVAIIMGVGCLSLVSIKLGEGNLQQANDSLKSAAVALFTFSSLIAVILFAFAPLIIKMFGANEVLMDNAVMYLRVLCPFMPMISLFFLSDASLKSMGRPYWAMSVVSGTVVANIVLDLLFVAGFGWGVKGAALATGLAFSLGVLFNLPHLLNGRNILNLRKGRFNWKMTGHMFYNGSSEGISELSAGISTMFFNLAMMKYLGEEGVAAFTALNYVMFIGITVFLGVSDGILPIIGYNHGAGNISRIKHTLRLAIKTNLLLGILLFGLVSLFGGWLISLFFNVTDSRIIEIAVGGSTVYAFAFLMNGFNILSASYFTALGNARLSIIVSLLRGLVFIVIGITLLPEILGINGIWLAMPVGELLTLFVSVYLVRKSLKKMDSARNNRKTFSIAA